MMRNTDGVCLYKSSKFSIWPFSLVNELPVAERFRPKNVILAGLRFGHDKPNPQMYMSALKDEIKELYRGIDLKVDGVEHSQIIRGLIICGS